MSSQWSQPLNLSQVLVYSLGCEHGRRWILKHSIVIKYTKVVGIVEFYVYVTYSAFKRRKIYSFLRKMWFILWKLWLQSRDTMHLISQPCNPWAPQIPYPIDQWGILVDIYFFFKNHLIFCCQVLWFKSKIAIVLFYTHFIH